MKVNTKKPADLMNDTIMDNRGEVLYRKRDNLESRKNDGST